MKRLLVAGICVLASTPPGRAEVPVIDNASLGQLFEQVRQACRSCNSCSSSSSR